MFVSCIISICISKSSFSPSLPTARTMKVRRVQRSTIRDRPGQSMKRSNTALTSTSSGRSTSSATSSSEENLYKTIPDGEVRYSSCENTGRTTEASSVTRAASVGGMCSSRSPTETSPLPATEVFAAMNDYSEPGRTQNGLFRVESVYDCNYGDLSSSLKKSTSIPPLDGMTLTVLDHGSVGTSLQQVREWPGGACNKLEVIAEDSKEHPANFYSTCRPEDALESLAKDHQYLDIEKGVGPDSMYATAYDTQRNPILGPARSVINLSRTGSNPCSPSKETIQRRSKPVGRSKSMQVSGPRPSPLALAKCPEDAVLGDGCMNVAQDDENAYTMYCSHSQRTSMASQAPLLSSTSPPMSTCSGLEAPGIKFEYSPGQADRYGLGVHPGASASHAPLLSSTGSSPPMSSLSSPGLVATSPQFGYSKVHSPPNGFADRYEPAIRPEECVKNLSVNENSMDAPPANELSAVGHLAGERSCSLPLQSGNDYQHQHLAFMPDANFEMPPQCLTGNALYDSQ